MKKYTLLLVLLSSCCVFTAQAHQEKTYDKNGGHYDDSGNYHCHVAQICVPTESRWETRRGILKPPRDSKLLYHEDDWPYWEYMGQGCQDARNQLLVITSQVPVTFTNPRNCVVREGLWIDEYTGEEYTRAAQMDVDHIIPPIYANSSDGYRWDYQTRLSFSNDLINLIPVSRQSHRKKRDRAIGSWRPREEFECEYASAWLGIAEKYDLTLFSKDRSRISKILDKCGIGAAVDISN